MNTYPRIKKVVVDCLGVRPEKVTTVVRLDDLGADSMDLLEIGVQLEEEFGIQLSDDELSRIESVSDAIVLIDKKV